MDPFLNNLVGDWLLSGNMGSVALRQVVRGQWVLQGNFLQLKFRQLDADEEPYEAIYMLGYDKKAGEYVMHLFDTFGTSYARIVGTGSRRGESVAFLFDYPGALFSNTFTWHPERQEWAMNLRQQEEDGGWRPFAQKRLAHRPASSRSKRA